MLLEPQETPYDLRFNLFGIPVRVHPMFWLFTAVLGWSAIKLGFEYVLLWIVCVFVSILIHELGHVVMGLAFGNHGYIVLYSFGGLAVGSNASGTWWKRVLVSFAGPLAGFVFLVLVFLFTQLVLAEQFEVYLLRLKWTFGLLEDLDTLPRNSLVQLIQVITRPTLQDAAFFDLFFINFFWGLLNLLPIFPLDGGQISRDVLTRISRERGLQISLGISFLAAALLAINAVVGMNKKDGTGLIPFLPPGDMFMAIMFGMLALQSFMYLQQVGSSSYYDHHDPWGGQGRPWER